MTRRTFSLAYKQEAVDLVKIYGLSVAEVAGRLKLHENVLRAWMRDRVDNSANSLISRSQQNNDVGQLRAELRRVTQERDVLIRALERLVESDNLKSRWGVPTDVDEIHEGFLQMHA
ncbi:transposase [Caballeronia zhejiangensis]|uniref:transposase n=1 Tax=Caballeronia zhejiangensis TaxID=871203 RepID=UPI00158C6B1D|nr:transposase [Caballeronia zhejiangensis]